MGSLAGCHAEEGGHHLRGILTLAFWPRVECRLRAGQEARCPVKRLLQGHTWDMKVARSSVGAGGWGECITQSNLQHSLELCRPTSTWMFFNKWKIFLEICNKLKNHFF